MIMLDNKEWFEASQQTINCFYDEIEDPSAQPSKRGREFFRFVAVQTAWMERRARSDRVAIQRKQGWKHV
ncbi:MAG TPA: hypothetical protein VGI79_16335 [Caulobacteraceae bacterium]